MSGYTKLHPNFNINNSTSLIFIDSDESAESDESDKHEWQRVSQDLGRVDGSSMDINKETIDSGRKKNTSTPPTLGYNSVDRNIQRCSGSSKNSAGGIQWIYQRAEAHRVNSDETGELGRSDVGTGASCGRQGLNIATYSRTQVKGDRRRPCYGSDTEIRNIYHTDIDTYVKIFSNLFTCTE